MTSNIILRQSIMQPLIIVESFTKTKTIAKYLNNKYTVICSLGHICDLPKTELGINLDTWEGKYKVTNKKIVENIRNNVRKASSVYLASDPDMEGEAIAHHIYNEIKDIINDKPCYRIKFHEITKKAVSEAINDPQNINDDVVNAQEARRFIDRLVGYKLSPVLWNKFTDNTLSVGRVQSVALAICVNILQKIQDHSVEAYWSIVGLYSFDGNKKHLEFKLCDDKTFETMKFDTIELTINILKALDFVTKHSISIHNKNHEESPSSPYTTTTLQQDAYSKHRFSSKKTMHLAQELYEHGHITYMRTDSTNISDDFKHIILAYVREHYGEGNAKFRNYKNKISNAQEAHEAIRITNINDTFLSNLSEEHNKLYRLIWKRTVASQMVNARYQDIEILLSYKHLPYVFKCMQSFLISSGYLAVYDKQEETNEMNSFLEKINQSSLKPLEYISEPIVKEQPSLLNEIGLIKALEKEGIGRPSTYSSIVDKLFQKKYVEKGSNPKKEIVLSKYSKNKQSSELIETKENISLGGKSKDLLVPTSLGINIVQYLQDLIPFLLDIHFTSKMENALDSICEKQTTKEFVLNDFYINHLLPIVNCTSDLKAQSKHKETGIMKTKYGYCYYDAKKNKYTNIEAYLKWRGVLANALSKQDIKFISSLPKKLDNGTYLAMGQYGLYIKDHDKNIRLDKSKWLEYMNIS